MKGVESIPVADVARSPAETGQRRGDRPTAVDRQQRQRRHSADQDVPASATFLAILQGTLAPVTPPVGSAANRSGELAPSPGRDDRTATGDAHVDGPKGLAEPRSGPRRPVNESAAAGTRLTELEAVAPTTDDARPGAVDNLTAPGSQQPDVAPDVGLSLAHPAVPGDPAGGNDPTGLAVQNPAFGTAPPIVPVASAGAPGHAGSLPRDRAIEDVKTEAIPGAHAARDQRTAAVDPQRHARVDVATPETIPTNGNADVGPRSFHALARKGEEADVHGVAVSGNPPRQRQSEAASGVVSSADVGKPWSMPRHAATSGDGGRDDADASADSPTPDQPSADSAAAPGLTVSPSTEPASGFPPSPASVLASVPSQVLRLLDQLPLNGTSVVMRLDPPTLGSVVLRIVAADGQRVRVHFRVEDPAVRDTLADQWHQLETALLARGLVPDGFSVDLGSIQTSMDPSGHARRDAPGSGNGRSPAAPSVATVSALEDRMVESAPGGRYIDCRL